MNKKELIQEIKQEIFYYYQNPSNKIKFILAEQENYSNLGLGIDDLQDELIYEYNGSTKKLNDLFKELEKELEKDNE